MLGRIIKAAFGAVGGKLLTYGVGLLIAGGSGYYFYGKISTAFDKAEKYDTAVIERDAAFVERDRARQKLLESVAEHAVEVERMEQARNALAKDRSAILKAAQIEGGKFRKLKEVLKNVETWSNGIVPDAVKRLYTGEKETVTDGA